MSGLLGRLAGQALGVRGASRVRPAMSVHAQVPLSESSEAGASDPRSVAGSFEARAPRTMINPEDHVTGVAAITHVVHAHSYSQPRAMEKQAARIDSAAASIVVPQSSLENTRTVKRDTAPARLLDEVETIEHSPPAIAPAVAAVSLPLTGLSTASRETTEVHVHIGRIEVSAVHEAAAPARKSAPAMRQTLPLGDYLARRRPS